ncbi:amino acid adenylation domain-containing protein [Mucilaginibacter sp. SG538B]|uniref:non-ribosomal peptide synthetase n=1 Tax=Mucilaginibacter sp. SG538B TaxID=2587021 RepID=UPI00159EB233|nr:non-ribosomal peptide synthetase [Mucilaginibacter sp. SG538B]NVM67815.1 amino acid adenylation domain-containing protein [Mucilaginibacter sp. SG538B]
MEEIKSLLNRLREKEIRVRLKGNDLEVTAFGQAPGQDILAELKLQKPTLIEYLRNNTKETFVRIHKASEAQNYPLSSSQHRTWVTIQTEGTSVAYNMPGVVQLSGPLKKDIFFKAVNNVLERHESLRTVFKEDGNEIRQFVMPSSEYPFEPEYIDLRERYGKEVLVDNYIENVIQKHFDLENGPLLHIGLLRVEESRYILTYNIHHLIGDGWSIEVLTRDLFAFYDALTRNKQVQLPPLEIQYKDYATWQRQQIEGEIMEAHKNYWKEKLSGEIPIIDLPSEKVRPAKKTYHGDTIQFELPPSALMSLRRYCLEKEGSVFMGLLASVKAILYIYSNQSDIIVGTPVSGREHADLKNQIGYFINTLPLRTKIDDSRSFDYLFESVKTTMFEAFQHQAFPLDMVVGELEIKRDISRSTLFDILVGYQHEEDMVIAELAKSSEILFEPFAFKQGQTKFDLAIKFTESSNSLKFKIDYNTDIYSELLIIQLGEHLNFFMESALSHPQYPLHQIEILPASDKTKAIVDFNNNIGVIPENETIISLFERQVALHPNHLALKYNSVELSYEQVNVAANQICNFLKGKIVAGACIGILLERSEWMIISMLAILKAGCVFVPLDVDHPEERTRFIQEDSACRFTIDKSVIDEFKEDKSRYSTSWTTVIGNPLGGAYLIYTSGSTGAPKGAITTNRSIVNYNQWFTDKFRITSNDSSVLLSSFVFSGVYTSVFCTLLNGAALHVVPKIILSNADFLADYINDQQIRFLKITPSQLQLLVRYGKLIENTGDYLRLVVIGGDKVKVNDISYFIDKDIQVLYHYGASETTMGALTYEITKDNLSGFIRRPRVGKPILNCKVFILDKYGKLTPRGVAGEICVGGKGISPGYIHNAQLNSRYFIESPFDEGERLFKTGDIGRMLEDNTIELLGRVDNQVKIRGYRIEVSEIERTMTGHSGIKEAVVTAKVNQAGENELIGYFSGEADLDVKGLRSFIKDKLPDYMIPTFFIRLDKIPVNFNGKVDRGMLPEPTDSNILTGADFVEYSTEQEKTITMIWVEILGVKKISVNDSFFDLGGNSLKITILVNRLYKQFGVKCTLQEIFNHLTIRQQVELIDRKAPQEFNLIEKQTDKDDYPLSNAQQRLWAVCLIREANVALNIPSAYVIKGNLNYVFLQKSLEILIKRHEILRTIFTVASNGEPRQRVIHESKTNVKINYLDFLEQTDGEARARADIAYQSVQPFELTKGPLIRISLYHLTNDTYVLSAILHHIISDGWSMFVLMRELVEAYNAMLSDGTPQLQQLRIQYKDYAAWQRQQIADRRIDNSRKYWIKLLAGDIPQINLPSRIQRPSFRTYKGDTLSIMITGEQLSLLRKILVELEGTMFMALVTVVNSLLYKYTGQSDIVLGSPFAGREHADLESQIGFYVNLLPLRTQVDEYGTFITEFKKTKGNLLAAIAHQMYPFDELVNELITEHHYRFDRTRHPVFDVVVALLNDHLHDQNALNMKEVNITPFQTNAHSSSRFDLLFNFYEGADNLFLSINFNTSVYERSMIERVSNDFINILDIHLKHPELPINQAIYSSAFENGNPAPIVTVSDSNEQELTPSTTTDDQEGFKF